MTKVSLIIPARNEEDSVKETLESVFNQTRRPDEIIIADGCSTDSTVALIGSFAGRGIPIEVVPNEKILPGAGRNAAIQKTSYNVIAATDFGILLDVHWLEEIIRPFEEDPNVKMVAGRAVPRVRNEFESYIASVLHTANFRSLNSVPPEVIQKVIARKLPLPGGNSVAFTKDIWEKTGGYPDWLRASEDKLFARKVHRVGGKVAVNLNAVAYYDPRDNLWNVFTQFYQYGKGNAQSRQVSKAFWNLLAKSALGVFLFFAGFINAFCWYLLGAFVGLHIYRAGFRQFLTLNDKLPSLKSLLWIPLIVMTHHAAAIFGHSAGYCAWLMTPRYRKKHFEYLHLS